MIGHLAHVSGSGHFLVSHLSLGQEIDKSNNVNDDEDEENDSEDHGSWGALICGHDNNIMFVHILNFSPVSCGLKIIVTSSELGLE